MARYYPDNNYVPGGVLGICDRCSGKRRLAALAFEWTNLRVCRECWDAPPPQLTPPVLWPEGVPVPNSRPEPPNVFITALISDGEGNAISDNEGNAITEYEGVRSPEPEDL